MHYATYALYVMAAYFVASARYDEARSHAREALDLARELQMSSASASSRRSLPPPYARHGSEMRSGFGHEKRRRGIRSRKKMSRHLSTNVAHGASPPPPEVSEIVVPAVAAELADVAPPSVPAKKGDVFAFVAPELVRRLQKHKGLRPAGARVAIKAPAS
jgi:hypothetical protein